MRRRKNLDKRDRALAILLRGDWAAALLIRNRELRVARIKVAELEAELGNQLDIMADLAVSAGSRASEGGYTKGDRKMNRDLQRDDISGVQLVADEREDNNPEVFPDGTQAGLEIIALQVIHTHPPL